MKVPSLAGPPLDTVCCGLAPERPFGEMRMEQVR